MMLIKQFLSSPRLHIPGASQGNCPWCREKLGFPGTVSLKSYCHFLVAALVSLTRKWCDVWTMLIPLDTWCCVSWWVDRFRFVPGHLQQEQLHVQVPAAVMLPLPAAALVTGRWWGPYVTKTAFVAPVTSLNPLEGIFFQAEQHGRLDGCTGAKQWIVSALIVVPCRHPGKRGEIKEIWSGFFTSLLAQCLLIGGLLPSWSTELFPQFCVSGLLTDFEEYV